MTAAEQINADADRIEELAELVVTDSLGILADAIRPRLRYDTGGDYQLSGFREAPGRQLALITDVVDQGDTVTGMLAAGPRSMLGPWRWLQDGTRPRIQGAGRHPGTAGKDTFTDPLDRAQSDVDAAIARRFAEALP